MSNTFFSEFPERPSSGVKSIKGAMPIKGVPQPTDMPEKVAAWPGFEGKASNIGWGNKDPKVKQYPKSEGI